MGLLHGHEDASHGRSYLAICLDKTLHGHPVPFDLDRPSFDAPGARYGRRVEELHYVLRSYSAGRPVEAPPLHQSVGRRPVAVTIEEYGEYSAVRETRECDMVGFRLPFSHQGIAQWSALYAKSFRVLGTTAEADAVRRIPVLEAFSHEPRGREELDSDKSIGREMPPGSPRPGVTEARKDITTRTGDHDSR